MRFLPLGVCAWLLFAGAALIHATARDATPGDPGAPAARWPGDGLVTRDPARPTLVVTIHPRCPCTPATLEALGALLERAPVRPSLWLLVVRPAGAAPGFEDGPGLERARRLPAARVLIDVDGAEAARLGARTSGHVLLLDAQGALAFSGGITPGRGHHGPSGGAEALAALLRGERADLAPPVFGCPLAGAR